jgi:hypothetical protein
MEPGGSGCGVEELFEERPRPLSLRHRTLCEMVEVEVEDGVMKLKMVDESWQDAMVSWKHTVMKAFEAFCDGS